MKRKLLAEINVIPFVDIALVLLVIFMVAAPMLYTSLDVRLPKVGGVKVSERKTPPLILTLRQEEVELRWSHRRERLPVEKLPALVLAYRRRYPEISILIAADREIPYAHVAHLLDRLKRAGVERVGLLTQPP